MPFKKHGRQYDLVVFGATGYTGLMTAEHISTHFPTHLKWAVSGRSEDKLRHVVSSCKALNADRIPPEVEVCSLSDDDLLSLAKKTFCIITTVGPYARYGEHAFKACAEAGTHYVDCTGEAVWTKKMIEKYEAKAKETGAYLIPQCGIESGPSDLLTWSMASLIRSKLSATVSEVVLDVHKIRGAPSGGTLATVLGLFDVFSVREVMAAHEPYALSPVRNPRPSPKPSLLSVVTGLHTVPSLGLLHTSITAGTNAAIVMRTWGLLQREPSRRDQSYGPGFNFNEHMKAKNVVQGVAMHYALIIGGFLLMFVPPVRTLLRRLVFKPGEGPSKEDSAKEYIELRGIAIPDTAKPDQQAYTRAWFKGSMYYLTAIFIAQAAQTMLQDELELEGGVYTPACLGQGFIDRLGESGFNVETKLVPIP